MIRVFILGTIEFDQLCTHGEFTIFNLGDETVLTAVTRNMTFFEPSAGQKLRARSLAMTFSARRGVSACTPLSRLAGWIL
jgi:hypothetical protein